MAAKHRIASWVRLLALAAAGGLPASRVPSPIGRRRGQGAGVARIPPIPPDVATSHLGTLLDLYRRGMREPLPDLLQHVGGAGPPARGADRVGDERRFDKRGPRSGATSSSSASDVPFDQLRDARPRPDEDGPGWAADEPTRIGRYARRLWGELLAIEERVGL